MGRKRGAGGSLIGLLFAVFLALILLPRAALAQGAPPPPLEDTGLLGTVTSLTHNCVTVGGAGTVTFTAAGQVTPFNNPLNGPEGGGYTGTFTETGTIQYSPFGNPISFQASFTITTAGANPTRIEGTKVQQFLPGAGGGCVPGFLDITLTATFDALITTPDGSVYRDLGRSEVRRVFRNDATGASQFEETFANSLNEPPQIVSYPAIPSPFRLSVSRSAIRFRLLMPAQVTFTVQRRLTGRRAGRRCVLRGVRSGPRCYRYRRVGSFRRYARRGRNRVALPRKLRPQRLRPGVYRLVATANSGGVSGPAEYRSFRVGR